MPHDKPTPIRRCRAPCRVARRKTRSRRPISCRRRSPRSCCARPAPARWRRSTATAAIPIASLVNVATDADGAPLLLVSKLAMHTKNNPEPTRRASLMLDETARGRSAGEGARVMLMGTFAPVAPKRRRSRVRRRLSAPPSEGGNVSRALPTSRSTAWRSAARIWSPASAASSISPRRRADRCRRTREALIEAEADAIAHMNADHAEACRLYATKLLGAPDGDWACVGIDPEGHRIAAAAARRCGCSFRSA